jgi:PAS domain S-box-containing protein
MSDKSKTKEALIQELNSLQQKITDLENEVIHYPATEGELRDIADKYRQLVDSANSIIITMDKKGKITFINSYAQRFFGYSEDEILGRDVNILVPPIESNGRNLKKMMAELLRDPNGFEEKINENILKDGTRVWISWRNKAMMDSRGRVVGNLAVGQDITRLKRSEEDLRTNEMRFRSLFENSIDGIMIAVTDGSILSANARMCEMLGMTEEEIVLLGRDGVVVKDEKLAAALDERARTGKFHGELTFLLKNGSFLPTEVSSIIFQDFDGTIKVGQVVRDITQRKQAEQALREAHNQLELRVEQRAAEINRQMELLDLAHDAIIVTYEDGRIVFWSRGAQETYGWTRTEAAGKILRELLKTQFPFPSQDIMDQAKRDNHWEGELVHTHKNGKQIVVLSRWALRRDGLDHCIEIMEVNRNISIRKNNEIALQKAGTYNRCLIEANLDPLVTIGPDGRITDVNSATEEVTGYPRDVLIGTDFSSYFTDFKKAKSGYKLVFKKGFVRDYELAICHRDGHITPVLYNASVYKDEAGQVVGVFAAARDVTERKRSEKEIMDKAQALEELNTALKVLIDRYKNDQRELEERIISNIKVRILPYLEKLARTQLDIGQSALLEIIERNFRDISSPFLKVISAEQFRFTPKEIQMASLIKEGKTTKEIALILSIGKRTVDSYRDNIRRKLGIVQKKVNLRTYLFSIHNP